MRDEPWLEFGLTTEQVEAARRKWAEALHEPFEEVPWQVVFIRTDPLTQEEMAHMNAYAKQLVAEGR